MKRIFAMLVFFLLLMGVGVAHGEEDFAKAEELIKSRVSCNQLDDDQLELMGDYFMEQMHPGELHEIMDERMGGEGSESLRQVHINMARSFYCGEDGMMSGGMMNMMMGRSGFGMMDGIGINTGGGGDMMGNYFGGGGYGMYGMGFFGWIFMLLVTVALILLIIWLYKQIQKK